MVAGIGCRTGVSGEQVEAAIEAAIAALRATTATVAATHHRAAVTAIATPATKVNEPGIRAAAAARRVRLLAIPQPALEAANPATVTRSEPSMAAMNVHSVAEAAALAGVTFLSSDNLPRLLQPRVVAGPVTCALADTTPP